MKRVTMSDVARQAGVSKSTVSHVLNDTRYVAEETKQRVLEAIEDLHYRPSKVARSLASQRTNTVGLLISDVGNPFYHQVILGVEDIALKHDYSVFLFNASYDLERSQRYILSMIDRRVDGVMFMSSRLSDALIEELAEHQVPAIVLDWEEPRLGDIAAITLDFETGLREAVEHLLSLGHRHFAHVSGPLDLWTARQRRDMYLSILEENGIDPAGVPVVESNLRTDGGRRALRSLLDVSPRPTAVFAANDLLALGVMWEAMQYGFQVPAELSIIGLDGIELSAEITPSLTTVALPRYEIGARAMTMLLDMIETNTPGASHRAVVHTRLVVRQSIGPAPECG